MRVQILFLEDKHIKACNDICCQLFITESVESVDSDFKTEGTSILVILNVFSPFI